MKCLPLIEPLTSVMRGLPSAFDSLRDQTVKETPKLQPHFEEIGNDKVNPILFNVLQNSVVEAFSDCLRKVEQSNSKSNELPFGELAVSIVCCLTNEEIPYEHQFEMIASIPVLQVHGQLEESFLKLKKRAKEIDTIGKGD